MTSKAKTSANSKRRRSPSPASKAAHLKAQGNSFMLDKEDVYMSMSPADDTPPAQVL